MRSGLLAGLALLLGALPALAYDVEVLQDNGDPARRIDIVVLGDGYRDIDQQKLTDDVNDFLAELWQETPYRQYRSYFNVKLIHVVSNETGADDGSYGSDRDTALGAYYYCAGIERALCVDAGAVYSVVNSHTPEWDYLFVIVNDPKYGGTGGAIAVISVHSLAGQIAIHEFGHTFGHLADEYEDPYPGFPQCGADCPEPNVTNHSVREQVKWNIWIDAATPVPTPETSGYAAAIGLFEGARYQSSGVYRPKQMCMMRALGQHFDSVCSEATVLSVYAAVSPLDAAAPPSPLTLGLCDAVTLAVQHPTPDPDTMLVTWLADGNPLQTGTDSFQLRAQDLGAGSHVVTVRVEDTTTLVRNDPGGLLYDEYDWQVDVVDDGQGVCLIGGSCYSAGAPNPQNPCQACDPLRDPNGWSADDAASCDDGLFCNGPESCSGGTCQAGAPPCSDDGLDCTGTCSEDDDACNVLQPGFCLIDSTCRAVGEPAPDNPCLVCDPARDSGAWSNNDGATCSDGLFCNGEEVCSGGACQAGSPPCADDGLDCTSTCSEDDDACNVLQPGFCLIDSTCVGTGSSAPGNPCLVCDPARDPGAWSADDGASCDDGVFCNGQETCLGGNCQAGAPPCADDGLDCTVDCDESSSSCYLLQPGYCLIAGSCYPAGQVEPDNPCRACDPATASDAFTARDGQACDDGDPCTEADACRAGTCRGERSRECSERCPCPQGGCSCSSPGRGGLGRGLPLLPLLVLLAARRRRDARRPGRRGR